MPVGLIFHWGLYSVPAFDDVKSARRRKLGNGSEWYLKRVTETGSYRPISGWKETQKFHLSEYNDNEYSSFTKEFNKHSQMCDFDIWMELAVKVSATYVILTAKHHDGFCLWDTETTDYKSKVDLLKRFKDSAVKYGLSFGLYYSWTEFNKNCTKEYVNSVMIPQMNELKHYRPDIWWFDGQWAVTTKFANDTVYDIVKGLKTKSYKPLINDRLYGSKEQKELFSEQDYIGGGATYRVYSDRGMPVVQPEVPWEYIDTIGLSWGRNKQQESIDYKSGEELKRLYLQTESMHGRFLLNLGPDADGTLDKREVKSLKKFATLI